MSELKIVIKKINLTGLRALRRLFLCHKKSYSLVSVQFTLFIALEYQNMTI